MKEAFLMTLKALKSLSGKIALCWSERISAIIGSYGIAEAFVVRVFGTCLMFTSQVLLLRMLGPEQYGIYTYALTWVLLLSFFGKFGIEPTTIRYVAAYQINEEWAHLRGYIRWSLITVTIVSVIVSTLAFITGWLVFKQKKMLYIALISFALIPFNSLLNTRSAILQGLKKVIMAQFPIFILLPVLVVGSVFANWIFVGKETGGVSAMAAQLGATVVSLSLVLWYIRKSFPAMSITTYPTYRTKEWTRTAFSMLVISTFIAIIEQTDIIIIGQFLNTTDSGIYAAAKKVASLIGSGLIVVNIVAAPMFSEFHVIGKMDEIKRVAKLAARFSIIIALPTAMVIFMFGEQIMALFGAPFSVGYASLIILTTGQVINALSGAAGFFMIMTGNEKPMALVAGSCAFLNVVLNFILIPIYGLKGAATSTALSVAFLNIILCIYIYRKLRIHISVISLLEPQRRNAAKSY